MRIAASLAEPNLAVFNPSTWSAIRRTKDSYGRYLVAPDPSSDEVNSIWGVPVLVTTQIATGVGLLVDTTKFGRLLVREPLGIRMGTANDDFTRNLVRFVCEERMVLAVERPTAVMSITGLPTGPNLGS
jgi:HK97 family phage major capsid protein